MTITDAHKKAVASYGRALLATWLTVILAGVSDWQVFAWAAAASILPPVIRWVDPKDPAFGRIARAVEETATAKVAKATKKKASSTK